MQRLYDFIRRHPTSVDSFWAVMLFGFSLLWTVQASMGTEPRIAAVPIVALLSLVVALRRRAPEKMLLLALLMGVAQLVFDVEVNPADWAMLVIIYTVAASDGPRWAARPLSPAAWPRLPWLNCAGPRRTAARSSRRSSS